MQIVKARDEVIRRHEDLKAKEDAVAIATEAADIIIKKLGE